MDSAFSAPRRLATTLAWALGIGVLVGISPHTSGQRVLPGVVGGSAAAAAVVVYRRRHGTFLPALSLLSVPRSAVWALVAAAVLFAPTIVDLGRFYSINIWHNGHGLFLPFLIAVLARARLRDDPRPGAPEGTVWGLPVAFLGVALALLDSAAHTVYVSTLGLATFLTGFCLLTLGARRTRLLAVPLLLCLFLLPLPTWLGATLGLQNHSAGGTAWILRLFGIPAFHRGTTIGLPSGIFLVSYNCSGFSAFYAGMALAIALAACTTSPWRRALLVAAPWPLTVAANSVRTASLLLVAEWKGVGASHTAIHGLSGIAAFWAVLFGLLPLADWPGIRRVLR